VHVLFAQESRSQVRGRNGLDGDVTCLLRTGISGLLGDFKAIKARNGRSGGESGDPRSGSPAEMAWILDGRNKC
jgi:hypothetical protein